MSRFQFFIGPCVIESRELCFQVAEYLVNNVKSDEYDLTFKASYDKANRSSIKSFRGLGAEKGLQVLADVKEKYGLPVLTDFHSPDQADEVASVVDVLQIPAFLCRQTDMILAASKALAKHGGSLKVKKGQFLSPHETKNIVEKASEHLPKDRIMLTERGTSFGYNRLIVDMSSFNIMKSFGVKTVHDATHCVQRPGAMGTFTGGDRDSIVPLARAAIAAGADGVFMETHPNPPEALSDKTTALELEKVPKIVKDLFAIHKLVDAL